MRSTTGHSRRTYRDMRDFRKPPKQAMRKGMWKKHNPIFVIQKHAARRLHYDFRLEMNGVLKSWAVPKGPSTNPKDRRLAVQVEDHRLDYADFEGVIGEGEYGSGSVIVWDAGPYRNIKKDKAGHEVAMDAALKKGGIEIWLEGKKVRGGYALIRTKLAGKKENWLLIKMRDEGQDIRGSPTEKQPRSVLTDRTIEQVAAEQERERR